MSVSLPVVILSFHSPKSVAHGLGTYPVSHSHQLDGRSLTWSAYTDAGDCAEGRLEAGAVGGHDGEGVPSAGTGSAHEVPPLEAVKARPLFTLEDENFTFGDNQN